MLRWGMADARAIAKELRDDIAEREESDIGRLFYSEADLMVKFRAARMTVRRAISMLIEDGLIRVQHGKGTIIVRLVPRQGYLPTNDDLRRLNDDEMRELASRVWQDIYRRWQEDSP